MKARKIKEKLAFGQSLGRSEQFWYRESIEEMDELKIKLFDYIKNSNCVSRQEINFTYFFY